MNEESFKNEMRDRLAHIEQEIAVVQVELAMLKRVVYGAVGIVLVAVITAGMALVLRTQ